MNVELHSPAFASGEVIPEQYACDGENLSPPLAWRHVPAEAVCLALILDDPDSPGVPFAHWLLYNIPAEQDHLDEGLPARSNFALGGHSRAHGFRYCRLRGPLPATGRGAHLLSEAVCPR